MKQYYLSRIWERKLLAGFYDGTKQSYAKCVRNFLQDLKDRKTKGFSLGNLEQLLSLMEISIKIKHRGKVPLILKDKSHFFRCYLLLFEFIEKEKRCAR
ncbi:TPA: hypothetical protein R1X36_000677 [Campylobacter upsaliensis]|nr:hypothetical protein [Campylobacter upsaliensis]HEC1553660.1 hypothetical protein [Campylobacter upsaliensis]HEC1564697.1 hypothetical protein [Campylobacter upsaliensis]HEO8743289.1 hypothetical protein [Campylobacter upsaliensis]